MKKIISIIMAATIVFSSMGATALDVSAATETARTSTSDTATKRTGKKLTYDEAYESLKPLFEDDASTTTTTKPAPSKTNKSTDKLPAPTGLTAEKSSTKIVLGWNKVDGADAYRVYMRNSKTGKYEKYKTVKGEQCTVTDIQNNKEYKFIVAALDVVNGKYVAGTNSAAVTAIKPGTTQNTKPATKPATKPSTTTQTTQQQSSGAVKMTDFWGNEISSSMLVRRSTLTKDQKYLYDTALKAIQNGETTVKFNKGYSEKDLNIALASMDYDNPHLIWLKDYYYSTKKNGGYGSIRFTYHTNLVKDRAGSLQKMDDYLKPMLTKASKLSSDVAKVKYVHDWLIYNTSDGIANDSNIYYHGAYAAIVDKQGVCQAYSYAFEYCMQKLGIQSAVVDGTTWCGEHHAWNMVKVGGDWYELDIYWDDLYTKAEKDFSYTYFMQTTASLKNLDSYNGVSRTRLSRTGSNLLPTAKGTKYSPDNYSYTNGTNFSDLVRKSVTSKSNRTVTNATTTTKKLPTGWYKYSPVLKQANYSSATESSWEQDGNFYILQMKDKSGKYTNAYIVYDAAYDNYYTWQSNGKVIRWYNYKTSSWTMLR